MASLTPLLLICHVTSLVSAVLLPPTNVKLDSKNFQHILTWDDPNNESAIYYNVTCHRNSAVSSKSSNITSRRCDLTKALTDIFSEYQVTVRSFTDREVSDIATSKPFTPISHTSLGPALVDVVPCDRCINVSIHPPISHLWSDEEQSNIAMVHDDVYPFLDYIIRYETSAESQHDIKMDDMGNYKVISELMPNTNYCVSVDVKSSLNSASSIPSAQQCVITGPKADRTDVILPVLGGLLLFLSILMGLFALDKAGYISIPRRYYPKVLKSLPRSESRYSGSNECTSPTYIVPVEIVSQKLGVEETQENEDKYNEGGYASRKKLLDSDTSAGDSSGPVLSTNSSSLESSGQMTESSGDERISTDHSVGLVNITDMAASFPPIPANALEPSSSPPLNSNGDFNINLNSICIGNSSDTWTGLKNRGSLKEESEGELDMNSGQAGLPLDGDTIVCASNVLVDLKPTAIEYGSDNYVGDLSDHDDCVSDHHVVSEYMRR